MNSPLISPSELKLKLDHPNLLLLDARYSPNPRQTYEKGHLAGAIFVDPNEDLADIKENFAEGGRHPLPEVSDFCETLGRLGINPESHLVIYDDQNGANAAARMWWMLRALGHQKVQVLEGGYQAALAAGFSVSKDSPTLTPTSAYPASEWTLGIASMDDVEAVAQDKNYLVIDVRSAERYRGDHEPIDLIAGHIPGAENMPLTDNMDASGRFHSPEQIRERYLPLFGEMDNEHIIVHCGSGVSACHTLLALDYAGLGIPTLYVGSWSEWSRNDKPIGKTLG
ncbi:sulfurtransferase [Algoriphagus sanaruensis]|uniref:Sulfurtransferase n=1 Tax=Algoriphagus sanaruensis TaxID=1727163 RepID=A0A142ES00_9BACT|nr:sulfurtransferase [Algoriphagus sanaruensis]AMQ57905.1 sulfurtransferase [Algoriphagus sanaruensis]